MKGPRIAAIGPKTAEELENLKIRVDFVPREYRAEAIYEGLRKEDLRGKRILIPRAKMARDVLPAELRKAGAQVEVVEVYQTIRPGIGVGTACGNSCEEGNCRGHVHQFLDGHHFVELPGQRRRI